MVKQLVSNGSHDERKLFTICFVLNITFIQHEKTSAMVSQRNCICAPRVLIQGWVTYLYNFHESPSCWRALSVPIRALNVLAVLCLTPDRREIVTTPYCDV
jgi:hypothetical protein